MRAGQGGEGVGVVCPLTGTLRKFTAREMERLLGFPDDYTLPPLTSASDANRQRKKALGNSFAVPVVRWILHRIHLWEEVNRVQHF